jgi:hypothetical protein
MPKTRVDYESALCRHVVSRPGVVAVGRVDQRRVRRCIADLLEDGASPARVRKAVGILKQVLDFALHRPACRRDRRLVRRARRCGEGRVAVITAVSEVRGTLVEQDP